ncbi:MAG: HAD-IA family hydrolase [Bacteroidota bacterium]|nr:HAD-IA family hydrolase [Bacteroidota bacterium]
MKNQYKILFCDIGGVLLSNGWGHKSRMAAAAKFNIDYEEMDDLHDFVFNVFEIGKISLDVYLDTVVFNVERKFSREEFKEFMFGSTTLLPHMLPWFIEWKKRQENVKIISINNEARELNQYRINTFKLHDFFDAFVSSCEVGMRKPDPGIFHMALGIAQAKPEECLYFDDNIMLVEAAKKVGIHAHHHIDFETTKEIMESLY